MADKESESDEEEDEEQEKEDEKKKLIKKKSSQAEDVKYFGAIKVSDKKRTTLAYVAVVLSLVGIIIAVFIFTNGLREYNYLSDFGELVKDYSGGGIFTMMMVLGVAAGVIQLFGCHVCFRVTISIERKKLYYWMWMYMMALIGLLIFFLVANLAGLIYWLSASSAFKVGRLEQIGFNSSRPTEHHRKVN